MSFEQWYHEVQCIRDHYPEAVVQESIIQSPKGALADMAQYTGPSASINHILQKVSVIFDKVALFDVLMQNIYKVSQGNNEKFPSFATRLEGPKPNPVPMPREDDRSGGQTVPQGLPLPWSKEIYLQLHSVHVQCPWCIILATDSGCSKGHI